MNTPVNIELAKQLNSDKNTCGVLIPLGATINMAGAAITIITIGVLTFHILFMVALLIKSA